MQLWQRRRDMKLDVWTRDLWLYETASVGIRKKRKTPERNVLFPAGGSAWVDVGRINLMESKNPTMEKQDPDLDGPARKEATRPQTNQTKVEQVELDIDRLQSWSGWVAISVLLVWFQANGDCEMYVYVCVCVYVCVKTLQIFTLQFPGLWRTESLENGRQIVTTQTLVGKYKNIGEEESVFNVPKAYLVVFSLSYMYI